MKYRFFIVSFVLLLFVSCQEPIQQLVGSYSYKSSGKVMVDSTEINLSDEIGAMDLIRRSDSTLLITFNQLGGAVYMTDANVEENEIVLKPYERTLTITYPYVDSLNILADTITLDRQIRETFDVVVNGYGERLNETIIFSLTIVGESQTSDARLKGEDILMIAKKN